MSRGGRREDIFLDEVDRQDFLKTLAFIKLIGFFPESRQSLSGGWYLVLAVPITLCDKVCVLIR
jgi:hypothetical protein